MFLVLFRVVVGLFAAIYEAVHFDAGVGTDCGTCGASYAGAGIGRERVVVTSVVYLLGL